ncbi:MAG: Wzz/FepE/Etk N-terminal domain-containing protein, partial [Coriobacteriia bacterium]
MRVEGCRVEELDLRDYISVIMARKWVIIGITAAVTVVALAVSLVQTPVYEGI